MLQLALEYAEAGWPVFPCRPADEEVFNPRTGEFEDKTAKSPYTDNGLKAATTREHIIRRWWADHPAAMVGVPTGERSGVWVLDLDKKPDADGTAEIAKLEAENGPLPDTVTVRTPSGGRHLLFKLPPDVEVRNRGGFAPAVDTRGEGGYIVAAGSVMTDGRAYEWESRPSEPADAPTWLLDLVVRKAGPSHLPALSRNPSVGYVDAAVSSELSSLSATRAGRNNALNDSSFAIGTFVGAGAMSRSEAEQRLFGAAVANGYVGKDGEAAARATIKSGLDRGIQSPREIPDAGEDMVERGRELATRLLAKRQAPVPAETSEQALEAAADTLAIHATPFVWKDPSTLPRRDFIYGVHYIRKYVSVTVAPGGLGKSSLTIAEALAMVTGRDLIGTKPDRALKVWVLNLEDDRDELERRIMAACKHYKIKAKDIEGRLFLDSGREQEVVVAVDRRKEGFMVVRPVVDALVTLLLKLEIDLLIVDPFVSSHQVSENDNGLIDKVAKLWSSIADQTNCSVEIVHHVRKVQDREVTVEDARGAVSLLAAARSARVLNRMTEEQAQSAGIDQDERFTIFGVQRGKSNLAPLSASSEWRKLESVPLGNGQGPMKPQDHAPVVTEWRFPSAEQQAEKAMDGVTPEQFEAIKTRIANSESRENDQAKEWAGHRVGEVLGIDSTDKANKKRIGAMLRGWIAGGQLEVFDDRVAGQVRKCIRATS